MTIDFDEVTWVDESDPDFDPDTDPKLDAANLQRYDDVIYSLITAVTAAEGDITSLSTGLDTAEDDITDAQSDITTLQSDVTALQNHDIVIATTVAGLGTAYDGKRGRLRLGSSPYQFIDLIYSSTYGNWVSEEKTLGSIGASAAGNGGNWVASLTAGSNTPISNHAIRKMEAILAGLTLQTRFVGQLASSVATSSMLLQTESFDMAVGGAPSLNGASLATIGSISSASAIGVDSGWLAASLNSTNEIGGVSLILKNSGGSTSTGGVSGTFYYRWVA